MTSPHERSAVRRAELWLWPLALVLAIRLPDLFRHYVDWDEAAMMSQAWAMTRGQVLYRDIFQFHPPLNFLAFAPFFKLLPAAAAPHAIKAMNAALAVLAARMAGEAALRWTERRAAALTAAVCCAWLLGQGWAMSSYGEFYMLIPLLGSVLVLQGPRPRWAAAGALWGVAFFFKQVAVFDAAALAAGFLWLSGARPRDAARAAGAALGGALSVAGAVAAWEAARGALPDAVRQVLLFPLTGYAAPVPLAARAAFFARHLLGHAAAAFWPCWLAIAAGSLLGRAFKDGERRAAAVCGLWLAAALAEIWAVGRLHFHYALALVPPACLLAGLFAARADRPRRALAVRAAAVAMLALAAGPLAAAARVLAANGWRDPGAAGSAALAGRIRADTRDGDRVFLYGLTNLDAFYLSGRLASHGIYMFIDASARHLGDPAVGARAEAALAADPPALIAVNASEVFRRAADPRQDRFMRGLLDRRYALVETLGIAALYRLKPPPGPRAGRAR
jgi:hypothetical protein